MAGGSIPLPQASLPSTRGFLQTARTDAWWLFPAVTFVYFLAALLYLTWAAWQGEHYYFHGTDHTGHSAQYLSPAYSPLLWIDTTRAGSAPLEHAWFGEWPAWLPKSILGILPVTPAFLILIIPGGFRFTCYYYRGAYYKAFWGDPPNCAVGEPRKSYWGERWAPLVLMNAHRYFMYGALAFIVILSYDALLSFIFVTTDAAGRVVDRRLGVGVGSLVLTANAVLLAFYTFGCHSLRHVIGGKKDCVSASGPRYGAYKCVSCFNRWHMQWAWISLFWVCFADLYVRLCSMGIWTDYRLL